MRRIFLAVLGMGLAAAPMLAAAGSVWVDGYVRSDGTYVQGHYRSTPDGQRWNNFGPSQNDYERMNPYARDYDNDGLSNSFDMNDDNDLYGDDWDSNPYGN